MMWDNEGNARHVNRVRTAESVRLGHPDKLADRIADSLLDAYLRRDKHARVAAEVLLAHGNVILAGECTSTVSSDIDHEAVVRAVLLNSGYEEMADRFQFTDLLHPQAPEIGRAVAGDQASKKLRLGAGDQGVIYGYACNDTEERLPTERVAAHAITTALDQKARDWSWLRPDGKCLVALDEHSQAVVLASTSHAEDEPLENIRDAVRHTIIEPCFEGSGIKLRKVRINPAGSFVQCGPEADTGLTGRKLAVDGYGGRVPHGGGAWSGKDPTKVDRSAAYYARFVAKRLLEEHYLDHITIGVTYAIGDAWPIHVGADVNTSGFKAMKPRPSNVLTGYDFSVQNMIDELDLRRPIYEDAVIVGHLGAPSLPWEAGA